jgi:DNA-binding transcriptional MerR regulator
MQCLQSKPRIHAIEAHGARGACRFVDRCCRALLLAGPCSSCSIGISIKTVFSDGPLTCIGVRSSGSRDTIRLYERKGLITSVVGDSETNNNQDYAQDNVVRLDFFTKARDTGMSIADLRESPTPWPAAATRMSPKNVVRGKFGELKKRVEQSQRAVDFLERIGSAG